MSGLNVSSADPRQLVESVSQNFYKLSGKLLILPEMSSESDYQAVASKIGAAASFKGAFKLRTNFGKLSQGDTLDFRFVEKETPVGQVKRQVSFLTGVPVDEIQISFQSFRPLRDETLFSTDLNCNGKGGENVWLTRVVSTEMKRDD